MKSRINPFVRISSLLTAASIAFAASTHAADFTWDGGTGNWTDTNWNGATATGPVTAGNTATINSGNVTVNVGGPGNVDSITLGSGAQLNVSNSAYNYFGNLILQGGTFSGSGNYNAYGAAILGNVSVSGAAASTIAGSSFFNISSTTTFTVADATGDANSDLLVTTSLRGPTGSPDTTYNAAKLIKEGAGTMEFTTHSWFWGGLDLNAGTLKAAGGNGGYGFFSSVVTVNAGTTLTINSDGTGFGFNNGWKPTSVNINGGTVNGGGNHIWGISGGVNMTGGTLQVDSGSFQWNYTNLNTNASADTATIAGPLSLRGDGGYSGLSANVADGAAATDLLISGNITETYGPLGITKSGAGTMVLSGDNSYTGPTTVSAGTLVLSGNSSAATGAVTVNAGVLSLGDGTNPTSLNDVIAVSIAFGAQVNLNFTGNDVVGSLEIDGSGPLPAGLYNSSHGTYGSYFTGGGSLQILGASGTWTSLSDGNWGDAPNWAGNTVAVGYDATATFNAATGVTVTLDSNRIIGNLAFGVSDYVIAGGNTLTLDTASTTPAISVTPGRTATISAGLAGNDGMEKTDAGTLVFTGVKTYTGGTTVTSGTLELAGGTSGNSIIRGALTISPGATVALTGGDGSGFGWNNPVTSINIDNGTINAANSSHIGFGAAASMTLDNGGSLLGTWQWNGDGLLSFSSSGDSTNTISGLLVLRGDAGTSHTFTVNEGAAATDLQVNADLTDQWPAYQGAPASGLTKSGDGTMVLNGTNTYDGNTVINGGALNVTATSSLHFRPTTNGVNNSVSSTGSGSLTFTGTVDLDLSAAVAADGNVWNLFNLGSFTVAPDLSSVAAVTSTLGSFSEVSAGTWELAVTGAKWVFTEADGNLAYVNDAPPATPYQTWGSTYGLDTGSESGDLDNDGLSNFQEFAFGLIPNDGSSVNPITAQLDKTSGQFSYQRLNGSGLTYTIWTSTDLVNWTEDTTAGQAVTTGSPNDSVQVTLSGAPLTASKLFVRVKAE